MAQRAVKTFVVFLGIFFNNFKRKIKSRHIFAQILLQVGPVVVCGCEGGGGGGGGGGDGGVADGGGGG